MECGANDDAFFQVDKEGAGLGFGDRSPDVFENACWCEDWAVEVRFISVVA